MICTQRLAIKPFEEQDREALSGLLENEAIQKTYMIPDFPSREALDKMTGRFMALSRCPDRFVRGIYLDGGLIGFVNDVELAGGTMELGYVIRPDCWGRGYATEMLRAVIRHLLEKGFAAVRTGAFEANIASIRVMEKSGMQRISHTDTIEYRGIFHNCVYYEARNGMNPF